MFDDLINIIKQDRLILHKQRMPSKDWFKRRKTHHINTALHALNPFVQITTS